MKSLNIANPIHYTRRTSDTISWVPYGHANSLTPHSEGEDLMCLLLLHALQQIIASACFLILLTNDPQHMGVPKHHRRLNPLSRPLDPVAARCPQCWGFQSSCSAPHLADRTGRPGRDRIDSNVSNRASSARMFNCWFR
jgi:hypothetical protein